MNRTQAITAIGLALLPLFYLFVVPGCFLVVVPVHALEHLLSCHHHEQASSNNIGVRLARLVGCTLLGQALSCLVLLYPLVQETYQGQQRHDGVPTRACIEGGQSSARGGAGQIPFGIGVLVHYGFVTSCGRFGG